MMDRGPLSRERYAPPADLSQGAIGMADCGSPFSYPTSKRGLAEKHVARHMLGIRQSLGNGDSGNGDSWRIWRMGYPELKVIRFREIIGIRSPPPRHSLPAAWHILQRGRRNLIPSRVALLFVGRVLYISARKRRGLFSAFSVADYLYVDPPNSGIAPWRSGRKSCVRIRGGQR